MEKKSNSIVIWRIIFTYFVTGFHFDNQYLITYSLGLDNGTYLSVEFFFMVTGYLMYEGYLKNPTKYPPVGPSIFPGPPEYPEKTGSPTKPSRK